MPRIILGMPQSGNAKTSTPARNALQQGNLRSPQLQQRLRQVRSRSYIEAMARLDAGTHHHDQAALRALIEAISNEFPDLGAEHSPIGIVSQCYLGTPYEVHICDMIGEIIEHFETFRTMPPLYERGRALALHPSYAFIEIYRESLRAVSPDGSVAVIEK
ncbi:MAG: hypothetical protein KIT57_07990 [Blastocatellales bacterium]|nr:hypothetical protein [Blastocatellales bacterium]